MKQSKLSEVIFDDKRLDVIFDDKRIDVSWMETMNFNLMDLKKRVETIERYILVNKLDKSESQVRSGEDDDMGTSPSRMFTSFATARSDGIGGLKTCLQIIKSTRIATVQCLWLILCLVLLTYFVIFHLEKVMSSHEAEYKPQRKTRVINFAEHYEKWQMPEFSLVFLQPKNNTSFKKGLQDIVSSSEFECRFEVDNSIAFKLAKPIRINFSNEYALWSVTAEPENPQTAGPWYCGWKLRSNLTSNAFSKALFIVRESADDVIGGTWRSINLPYHSEETAILTFEYSEKVTETIEKANRWTEGYKSGIVREFASSIYETHVQQDPTTSHNVEVYITMNPQVEYWQEYVGYTLQEAAGAIGGIINILTFVYFWVGYYIAVLLARHSWEMGILPQMSFIFTNLENIYFLKECLNSNNIIPRTSRWFGRAIASETLDVESTNSNLVALARMGMSPGIRT